MKGLMLLHTNMEDAEALATRALLERMQIDIITTTFNRDKRVKMAYNVVVEADILSREVNVLEYDFLIIPGGKYVSEVLNINDNNIKNLIMEFHKNNKVIAAICAAPMFLGELGLLEGKEYTIFPSCEKDSYKGILKQDKKAITDGKIITGRSVGAVVEFSYEIIKKIRGKDSAEEFLKNIYY
ncbi:MAG: DJ-1/PfpI family protein [Acholeplasmataceae bacterium]|jgi:4-methyl-5(b-hydroxyethyl)-thiazole monophosphate biosynthesis|nr:DJ-1/PfpI family protein [Acholeplasmataceae bacterium]